MTTLPHNSQAGELKKAEKVFVIGLDGATFDLILPWANAGKLPNLNKIMENGVHGPLRSTIPPITPTAWASFRTGKNPGKHGVFDFYKRKANSYERRVTNSADIDGKALWTILSEA
ncbi:MAG: alkaline phosphatase family protein, partial [bacterium]